jgi:hypothetical protein
MSKVRHLLDIIIPKASDDTGTILRTPVADDHAL